MFCPVRFDVRSVLAVEAPPATTGSHHLHCSLHHHTTLPIHYSDPPSPVPCIGPSYLPSKYPSTFALLAFHIAFACSTGAEKLRQGLQAFSWLRD